MRQIGAFSEVIAVSLAIGGALMFAPYYSAHIVACSAFGFAMVWAAVGGATWMRQVSDWNAGAYTRAVGTVFFVLVAMPTMIWFALPAVAQTPGSASIVAHRNGGIITQGQSGGNNIIPLPDSGNHVTGANIVGNAQGGTAAEIVGNGTPGKPNGPAADIQMNVSPGQSATGLQVIQNGPGTALRVIQHGPGTGLRVMMNVGGRPSDK